jgi:hypothetical protein
MKKCASGIFEVTLIPQGEPDTAPGAALGRMSIDKQFQGDLAGVGKGEMLTAMTDVTGSAVYVAVERVTGTLHGRQGSFTFQHVGSSYRGAQQLTIAVVPDSGAGELAGITGELSLNIVDGKHFYTFEYSLPESALAN